MRLSNNFTLAEMTASQTATRRGITEQFEPSDAVIENLKKLCVNVLENLPSLNKGLIIYITSGYRCKRLNKAIGGAINSQHTEGKAVDIKSNSIDIEALFNLIKKSNIEYDQLIQEFGEWIHISYNHGKNRMQALRAVKNGGKTQYIIA